MHVGIYVQSCAFIVLYYMYIYIYIYSGVCTDEGEEVDTTLKDFYEAEMPEQDAEDAEDFEPPCDAEEDEEMEDEDEGERRSPSCLFCCFLLFFRVPFRFYTPPVAVSC